MLESEIIFEERRSAYEEQQRLLLARLMSEKGGMLMQGATDTEIERLQYDFLKQMTMLEYKFVDMVREDHGLDPNDNTATFGENMEDRWDNFFKSHIVMDEKGDDTILYEDVEGNYRLIPDRCPFIDRLEFIIKNFSKVDIGIPKEELTMLPSLTILGIEAISNEKYNEYNVKWDHKDFFITQIMIMLMQLFDIMSIHKKYLKEQSDSKLYKELEQRVKEIF